MSPNDWHTWTKFLVRQNYPHTHTQPNSNSPISKSPNMKRSTLGPPTRDEEFKGRLPLLLRITGIETTQRV